MSDLEIFSRTGELRTIKPDTLAEMVPECTPVVVRECNGKHAVCTLVGGIYEFQVDMESLLPL